MERNDAQEKYTVHKVSHIMGLVKVQKRYTTYQEA